mmetsp:Transcript_18246/g.54250  ORF Transcript_18246/g.54250 Transcript_18246/m.54250 type:complete len:229 (+) Transcript_18246:257-943(+)
MREATCQPKCESDDSCRVPSLMTLEMTSRCEKATKRLSCAVGAVVGRESRVRLGAPEAASRSAPERSMNGTKKTSSEPWSLATDLRKAASVRRSCTLSASRMRLSESARMLPMRRTRPGCVSRAKDVMDLLGGALGGSPALVSAKSSEMANRTLWQRKPRTSYMSRLFFGGRRAEYLLFSASCRLSCSMGVSLRVGSASCSITSGARGSLKRRTEISRTPDGGLEASA